MMNIEPGDLLECLHDGDTIMTNDGQWYNTYKGELVMVLCIHDGKYHFLSQHGVCHYVLFLDVALRHAKLSKSKNGAHLTHRV
jgi:hypothetical protein